MKRYVSNIDRPNVFQDSNLENMYIIFLKILHDGFNQYVPKKQIGDKHKPPWYNKRLINLKNQKNKAYKQYRKDKNNLNLIILYILNSFLYNHIFLVLRK